MAHVFESAPSGRAKCRGCGQLIPRGELRFGEHVPNPYAEGEMTLWFHPLCAAYKRPEPLLQALTQTREDIPHREELQAAALASLAHRRRPRIDGAERAPSGQAVCRSCRQPIARGSWRVRLVFYEDGRFSAGGFVHLACRKAYFETDEILDQVLHFSWALSEGEREDLRRACEAGS